MTRKDGRGTTAPDQVDAGFPGQGKESGLHTEGGRGMGSLGGF